MLAWPRLEIPRLDVHGPAVSVYDTENRSLVTLPPNDAARMYVCGITPYDSTHLGHAATYVGFDLLNRAPSKRRARCHLCSERHRHR